jgi:hypothetical protein
MWLVDKSNIRFAQNIRGREFICECSLMRACNYFNVLKILGTLCRCRSEKKEKSQESFFINQNIECSSTAAGGSQDKTYAFVDALVIIEVPSFTVSRSLLLNPFYAALNYEHQQLPKLNLTTIRIIFVLPMLITKKFAACLPHIIQKEQCIPSCRPLLLLGKRRQDLLLLQPNRV